jgi:hypothetical protein
MKVGRRRTRCAVGAHARGVWGHAPPENFAILDVIWWLLVHFEEMYVLKTSKQYLGYNPLVTHPVDPRCTAHQAHLEQIHVHAFFLLTFGKNPMILKYFSAKFMYFSKFLCLFIKFAEFRGIFQNLYIYAIYGAKPGKLTFLLNFDY